jgi:AcrR family transcriptional regulator
MLTYRPVGKELEKRPRRNASRNTRKNAGAVAAGRRTHGGSVMGTRQDIARAALELFLLKGYENTSLNDIADEVGLTKPAIYHHYESKDALFHEVLTLFFDGMKEWSAARLRPCRTLEDLMRAMLTSIGRFRDVANILLEKDTAGTPYSFTELFLTASRRDPDIRRRIEEGFVESRRLLSERIRAAQESGEIRGDIDCEVAALELHAVIEGVSLLSHMDHSIDVDAAGARLFENTWRMLSP